MKPKLKKNATVAVMEFIKMTKQEIKQRLNDIFNFVDGAYYMSSMDADCDTFRKLKVIIEELIEEIDMDGN